jgi:hypothetical protein
MGGRGASSGAFSGAAYERLLDQIDTREDSATQTAEGRRLRLEFGIGQTTAVQDHAMPQSQDMESVVVDEVRVRFPPGSPHADESIGTIAATWRDIPPTVRQHTDTITLSDQVVPGEETGLATGGAGDKKIVGYGAQPMSKVTLVHETVHNYMEGDLLQDGGLAGTRWSDVVDGPEPSPYSGSGAVYEEDFAESAALWILDKTGFTAAYPQRAAVVGDWLNGRFP